MLKSLRSWILRLIRQTLGTQQILEQRQLLEERNERRHLHQMDFMLALGNAITYSVTDPEQLKATTVYRRCAEIISWLAPMDVDGGTFVRVGQRYDGGYVMFDALQNETVDAAYGFGISQDWSWDEAIADRGIDGHRRQVDFRWELPAFPRHDWPDVYLGTFSVEDEPAGTSRTNTVSRRSGGTSS